MEERESFYAISVRMPWM